MSFLIKCKNSTIDIYYNKRINPAPTSLFSDESHYDIIMGEIYHGENIILNEHHWYGNSKLLLDVEGMFSVISVDKTNNCLYFATDKTGVEHIYLYKDSDSFMISDDFWDIVCEMDISYDNLDIQTIMENCVGWFYPENGMTVIKNLRICEPGILGKYDYKSNDLELNQYWKFKQNHIRRNSIDEVVECLDNALNKTFKEIKEKVGDVVYATGISGGLDSRIIPYYAQKNGLNIKSFILGCRRPKIFFLSKDHKNARDIVKITKLVHNEVEWNIKNFDFKVENEIRIAPMVTPQFFKYEKFLDFDCLITGASGSIVGGDFSDRLEEKSNSEIIKEIFNLRLPLGWDFTTTMKRRIEIALYYLFKIKTNIKKNTPEWHNKLFTKKIEDSLNDQCIRYVNKMKMEGFTNTDIFLDYFIQKMTYRNRLGAYESFLGQKRSFSIYMPYVYDEVLNWEEKFFQDRFALKELMRRKIPELSGIGSQNYLLAPSEKKNLYKKFKGILVYLIRGAGTTTDEKYLKRHKLRKYYYKKLGREDSWYRCVFKNYNGNDIKRMINDNPQIATIHLKHCVLLDKMQTQEYKSYKTDKYDFTVKIDC